MIDWTKPIRQKNGDNVKFIYELKNRTSKYPILCVVKDEDGEEYVATYTKDGRYVHNAVSARSIENIHSSEPTQPEIDWMKEVQYCLSDGDTWYDITYIAGPYNGCVWVQPRGDESPITLRVSEFKWRNKPTEPKCVKGWVGLYRSTNDVHMIAEIRTCRNDLPGEIWGRPFGQVNLIACFEIDVPEGHGLEEGK